MRPALLALMLAAATIALAASACFNPQPTSGRVTCSEFGECPRGYYCAWDRGCWQDGEGPTPIDLGARDLAPVDALRGDAGAADLARRD